MSAISACGIRGIILQSLAPASAVLAAVSSTCPSLISGIRTILILTVMPFSAAFLIPSSWFRISWRISDKPFKDDAVVYVSPSGIRDYLEGLSERNAEDAAPGNDRSSKQEKIRILKEAKKKLGTGVFLIDERNIPSARTWYAALSGREKLVLCRKDRASFFIVTESGIVDAFYSFMEELPESGNLLRTEIAARYVDSMMEE